VVKWKGVMLKPRYSTTEDVRNHNNESDNDVLA
jgi:hypothetical protein